MGLLVDTFGYLIVLLRGGILAAQGLAVGGVVYAAFVLRPLAPILGADGARIAERTAGHLIRWSAAAMAMIGVVAVATQSLVLSASAEIPLADTMGAGFALSGLVAAAAAAAMAALAGSRPTERLPALAALAAVLVVATAATSHAAARIEHREILLSAVVLHQLSASAWIGGILYFLATLRAAPGPEPTRAVCRRFSLVSLGAVATMLAGGIVMSLAYVDSLQAVHGTAYGAMLANKLVLVSVVLLLGLGNFLAVERLRRDPATPVLRLRRFAEAEVGIGLSIFFVGASLSAVPPAVDMPLDRLTVPEIVARMAPRWPPVLESPDLSELSNRSMAEREAISVSARRSTSAEAHTIGSTPVVPDTPGDIAWSEFNHNWAGVFVLAIGLLAVAERTGRAPWARHWPLVFLGLAVFLFIRSDPSNWPLGDNSFFHSFLDPEVLQHRVIIVIVVAFAVFEWGVRTGRIADRRAAHVFPILMAAGGAFLLTHSHVVSNFKEGLLIELSHLPIGTLGIVGGWARWLELRLPEGRQVAASWIWRIVLVLVGLLLLFYRES